MDEGASKAAVHRVAKSQTRLSTHIQGLRYKDSVMQGMALHSKGLSSSLTTLERLRTHSCTWKNRFIIVCGYYQTILHLNAKYV